MPLLGSALLASLFPNTWFILFARTACPRHGFSIGFWSCIFSFYQNSFLIFCISLPIPIVHVKMILNLKKIKALLQTKTKFLVYKSFVVSLNNQSRAKSVWYHVKFLDLLSMHYFGNQLTESVGKLNAKDYCRPLYLLYPQTWLRVQEDCKGKTIFLTFAAMS